MLNAHLMTSAVAPRPRLLANPAFVARYAELARVGLNPRRHALADAHTHSEAVAARAAALAAANGCGDADRDLLVDLGRAHDIGKVTGTARPERSLEVLDDQSRIATPEAAIAAGADYLVIGRPIRDARESARRRRSDPDPNLQRLQILICWITIRP